VKGGKDKSSWSVCRCGRTYWGQRTRHMPSKRHVQGQLAGRQWFFRGLPSCMDTGSSTIPYTWHPRRPNPPTPRSRETPSITPQRGGMTGVPPPPFARSKILLRG